MVNKEIHLNTLITKPLKVLYNFDAHDARAILFGNQPRNETFEGKSKMPYAAVSTVPKSVMTMFGIIKSSDMMRAAGLARQDMYKSNIESFAEQTEQTLQRLRASASSASRPENDAAPTPQLLPHP